MNVQGPQKEASTSSKRQSYDQTLSTSDGNDGDGGSPRKKRKSSLQSGQLPDVQLSRKGKACIACRKLKVKCDSAERKDAGCSRCQRLGLECVSARKLRMSLEGEHGQQHPSIVRLDKAVEDILLSLKMPPLHTYGKTENIEINQPSRPLSEFQTTRENSREPPEGDPEIAPAPMGSLYEVTQLNSLRSRLRKVNSAKRSSRRSMEADLVSQQQISLQDAEELLEIYKKSLARYLFATTMAEDISLQTLRESSTLLFTAIMLVSALHIPGKEAIHSICHKQFLELIATAMFEHFHTLDDIRALCIAAFWQPDLSWKLSGLCVRMATELNLHQSFFTAFYKQDITEEQRKIALEKASVWYLLYVLDHHFSIAYGRPPVTAALLPIKEYDVFVNSPWCTLSDRRLISQVSLFVTLSKAYEVFGLEPERLMGGDNASLQTHARFTEEINAWRDRWQDNFMPDKYIADYPSKGVYVHYHFSSLMLNSLALRGRSLDTTLPTALPVSLQPHALRAIESAHAILEFFQNEPSYRDSLVGVPLYLHSMIAFAVVFLIKMSHRWHTIGVTIDPETTTKPLIEGMINILNRCKAGSGHMVYSMSKGFERMLKNNWDKTDGQPEDRQSAISNKRVKNSRSGQEPWSRHHSSRLRGTNPPIHKIGAGDATNMESPALYHRPPDISQPQFFQAQPMEHNFTSPPAQDISPFFGEMSSYGDYGVGLSSQDDMLWSAGMGYDLLQPNMRVDSFAEFPPGAGFDGV